MTQTLFAPEKITYNYKADIAFSQNWNGKFFCKYLTTIRLCNYSKYHIDSFYRLLLEGEFLTTGRIVDVRYCKIDDLPDWTCMLDTGYSKADTITIFKNMYSAKNFDWDKQLLVIIMIENMDFVNTSLKRK